MEHSLFHERTIMNILYNSVFITKCAPNTYLITLIFSNRLSSMLSACGTSGKVDKFRVSEI